MLYNHLEGIVFSTNPLQLKGGNSMRRKPTDINEIRKVRKALRNLQKKIDGFLELAQSVPSREANKHISGAIHNFSNYTELPDYETLRDYTAESSNGLIFQYFDSDFEKLLKKRTFTLEEVFRFGQALLSTSALVNAEIDYIDRELL